MRQRAQHPEVHERKTAGGSYWFFRYWADEVSAYGFAKPVRKRYILGPSAGKEAIDKREAERRRDAKLAELNAAASKCEAVIETTRIAGHSNTATTFDYARAGSPTR